MSLVLNQNKVVNLEKRTAELFGKPVKIEELGNVLAEATRLYVRDCLEGDISHVNSLDFPNNLVYRLKRVIQTLERAFDGDHSDEPRLMRDNQVQIDGWIRNDYLEEKVADMLI